MRRLGYPRFNDRENTYRKMIEKKLATGKATESEKAFAKNGYKSSIRRYERKIKPL